MPATIAETMSPAAISLPICEGTSSKNGVQHGKFQAVARGNRSGTLKLQGIPEFTGLHEKRQWMKGHMAAAFRFFGKQGYGEGISGHISIRGMFGLNSSRKARCCWPILILSEYDASQTPS
jgi:hypothetical protein